MFNYYVIKLGDERILIIVIMT